MAKGPSAAAKKKALTEATKLRKDAVKAKAKTCLQKLEASEDDCDKEKSKVDLRVRSEEQAVDKCLKDNFPPSWGTAEFDVPRNGFPALRERIRADRSRCKVDKHFTMGKHYYEKLRAEYAPSDSAERQMPLLNPHEPQDPAMDSALAACLRHNKDFSAILHWLQTVEAVNQKVFRCLCKGMLRLSPTNAENSSLMIDVLSFVRRLGLQDKFPETWKPMREHFDAALCKSISTFKVNNKSMELWWDSFHESAGLLLPAKETAECVKVETDFVDVKESLKIVVESCAAGRAMFIKAHESVRAKDLEHVVEASVKRLRQGGLTQHRIDAERKLFNAALEPIGKKPTDMFRSKDIVVEYRGLQLEVPVMCVNDMWSYHVAALFKSVGVDSGAVPKLWCEDELVGERGAPTNKVEGKLLQPTINARAACRGFITDAEFESGEVIAATLAAKAKFLRGIDAKFSIDAQVFLSHIGDKVGRRFQEAVLATLPTEASGKLVSEALERLDSLQQGKLLKFCGAQHISTFGMVHDWVRTLSQDRCPNFKDTSGSAFLTSVVAALGHFVRVEDAASSGAQGKVLTARHAVAALFSNVEKKSMEKAVVSYSDIKVFHVYKWLVDPAAWKMVTKWTDQLHAPAMDHAHADVACEKKRGRKRAAKDDASKIVSDLYR